MINKTRDPSKDKDQNYVYMLCYVDDILCIHHNAESVFKLLRWSFYSKLGYGSSDMLANRYKKMIIMFWNQTGVKPITHNHFLT